MKRQGKQPRALWQVSVITSLEAEEAVAALFETVLERTPTVYTEAQTGETTVSVFCETSSEWTVAREKALRAGLAALQSSGVRIRPAKLVARKLPPQKWAESWKRHFRPFEIGSALLVKPSWSRRRPRKGQAVVVLDPGLSFGTGQHPTTAFCLAQLAAHRDARSRQSFLDIGTGSGILAIAAAKLGYSPVRAFDSDPVAVRVARENAGRNRVPQKVRIFRRDLAEYPGRKPMRFDFICANLLSTLLLGERRRIIRLLKPGGTVVLAGILKREFPRVQQAYEAAGLRRIGGKTAGEWRSGAFRAAENSTKF